MSFTVRTGRGTRPEATGGAIPAPSGGTTLGPYHGANLGRESIRQGVLLCDERPLLAPKKKTNCSLSTTPSRSGIAAWKYT